jgi:general secretion pathway protein J
MNQRGFTLLEVLVAMAILAIIMVTVYGVLSQALYAKNHSEERADLYASGREAVLKIADELEGALPPTAGRNIGFVGIAGTGRVPTDGVQFDVVVRRLFGPTQSRGGRALVSYSLDPLQDTNLFALRRQEQPLTDNLPIDSNSDTADSNSQDAAAPAAPVAIAAYLLDQVAGLRLRYLDPETGEWLDNWDNTVPPEPGHPQRGLPGAVEITLFLADNQGGVHDFGTIVDLPLANLAPPTPSRP